ncbi:hypothetical protein WMY93_032891 [Mugilogobius chulae]|uniref:dual-specificity kinase n=1 Tax=Mugilogobius chulae TaxID=88201 RepID=A0AAW0MUF2_9GOBI
MHKDKESGLQFGQRLRNIRAARPRKMGQNDQSALNTDPGADDTSPASKPHKTQTINQELTESTAAAAQQRGHRAVSGDHNDEEGHLVYHEGLLLNGRYEVVSTLGKGAFGKVAKCFDRDKNEYVAVKIVRNIDCFSEVARSEIAVLEEINALDDDNTFACVRMQDWFDHHGHICIVFELLGLSTCEFIQLNHYLPFSLDQIRHMAFQLFRAVCFLHRNKLTHTDLKPENILLVSSDFDLEYNENTVRMLKVTICVIHVDSGSFLQYFGHIVFYVKVIKKQHYVHNERLKLEEDCSRDAYIQKHCKPLKEYMRRCAEEERQLFDLLSLMLQYDVVRRITLEEALWHPFFSPIRAKKKQRS